MAVQFLTSLWYTESHFQGSIKTSSLIINTCSLVQSVFVDGGEGGGGGNNDDVDEFTFVFQGVCCSGLIHNL